MGFWTADKQRYAFRHLRLAGLTDYGAAALVSRWVNVESTANGPTAINPFSGAFGIAQWLGARKVGIYPNTNFDAQLQYAVRELNGSESRAGSILRSAASAIQGAIGASVYERAEGYDSRSGYDNFTNRTAAGVPNILALAGSPFPSQSPPILTAQGTAAQTQTGQYTDYTGEAGTNATGLVLIAAAAIGLWFVLR